MNWNPERSSGPTWTKISIEFKVSSNEPREIEATHPVELEPPHTPQSSSTAVPLHVPSQSSIAIPPHTPSQSTSTKQLPSQSKFSSAYVHDPSSSFASASE